MSIFRISKNETETVSVLAHPHRRFVSGSDGAEGSVHVFPRRSDIEKEVEPISSFVDSVKYDNDINDVLESAKKNSRHSIINGETDISSFVDDYFSAAHNQQKSVRKKKVLNITRFIPSYKFTKDTLKKLYVKDILNERYRTESHTANWAYTNYNSLNFFTSPTVNDDAALLYPNPEYDVTREDMYVGPYTLTGSFTFDFYINPRYTNEPGEEYRTGTVLHLSSSYAVSIVSGSAKDEAGRADGFRVMLQLGPGTDVAPSAAVPGNWIFLSDDNVLRHNTWHHVVVKWDADLNAGSFVIDGAVAGKFSLQSTNIVPVPSDIGDPDVLVVGNFYEGMNDGDNATALFFSQHASRREGLVDLMSPVDDVPTLDWLENNAGPLHPENFTFAHPLRGELHDVRIRRRCVDDDELKSEVWSAPNSLSSDVAFYLPPFFVQDSPIRRWVGDAGGILQTPFFEVSGMTDDPFNVSMSFGVAGHYINIENFLRDFASDQFPRVHHLSMSAIGETTEARSANEFLYDNPHVARRNLTIMPCDDGKFSPSYELLQSESVARTERGFSSSPNKYVDDYGNYDPSLISLDNLVSTASLLFGSALIQGDGESAADKFIEELIGFSPENPAGGAGSAFGRWSDEVEEAVAAGTYDPGVQVGIPLTIYQRTKDPSSNQVTFFNISNLYYGKRIKPGSFSISDLNLSGSGGAISVTLKDDGYGNLYRADARGPHATWASCGNVFYSEGLVVVKSPHLFFFGQNGYDIEFKGDQSIHVLSINALAPAGHLNSSNNPTYIEGLPASLEDDDFDKQHVNISGILFHDENLNVVAKAALAQPIMKRVSNSIKFRVRFDL